MFLYLVQHAEAKSKEEDSSRSLSKKGSEDIIRVVDYTNRLDININNIFHSGKTRALQTAEAFVNNLKPKTGVIERDGLAPTDDPNIWFERLSEIKENIMLVGHLPHLSRLASLILCGDIEKTVIDFKNACIVCLRRLDDGNWLLEWMIIPELIS